MEWKGMGCWDGELESWRAGVEAGNALGLCLLDFSTPWPSKGAFFGVVGRKVSLL